MKFQIYTIHPEIFSSFTSHSLIARAIDKGVINIKTINWRDGYGIGGHKQLDDRPFGGGGSMVFMPDPIFRCMLDTVSDFRQYVDMNRLGDNLSRACEVGSESYLGSSLDAILPRHDLNKENDQGLELTKNLDLESLGVISKTGVAKHKKIIISSFEMADRKGELDVKNPAQNKNNIKTLETQKDGASQNKSESFEKVEYQEYLNFQQKYLKEIQHSSLLPNNHLFCEAQKSGKIKPRSVNILFSPRGYKLDQKIVEWLTDFEEINLFCGRFEGFDSRINDFMDLEISLGDFILNGGEVAAMCLVEAVSRKCPGFLVKKQSAEHDSFSSELNNYYEYNFENQHQQYNSSMQKLWQQNQNTPKLNQKLAQKKSQKNHQNRENGQYNDFGNQQRNIQNLFNLNLWISQTLPFIEHPHYTRPQTWMGMSVPSVITEGDHKKIQVWRKSWFDF